MSDDYEVGYCKPPKAHQWKKGQASPNPKGRPRKAKPAPPDPSDSPMESALIREAYRKISVRENGKHVELSVSEGIVRSVFARAMTGGRLERKFAFELIQKMETEAAQAEIDRYVRLTNLKKAGDAKLADCKVRGVSPPLLLPHPADIRVDTYTRRAWVEGPQFEEDLAAYQRGIQLRDFLLALDVWQGRYGPRRYYVHEGKLYEECFVYAMVLQAGWPRSIRLMATDPIIVRFSLERLRKRELWQKIQSDNAALERAFEDLPPATPEVQKIIDRFVSEPWSKSSDAEISAEIAPS